MKSEVEVERAYEAIRKGKPVQGLDPRVQRLIDPHSEYGPSNVGVGFEQALFWVLQREETLK